ncbi:hypothetical protein L3073_18220 [Ancylomarina sp. DW003]|nr:hypothetical protein [Ancylomarina sp. DW003]MDE5424154.1 hypothetical protein [Ancylomarina sp. DW003]
MNRFLSLLSICLLLFSCNNPTKQKMKEKDNANEEQTTLKKNNYAVVWDWITADKELVVKNATIFNKELLDLWKNEDIENVYFDTEAKVENDMQFPSISFFVKAQDEKEAKKILDDLSIVKKKIASYKLHPVGMLWLEKKQDSSLKNVSQKSYVTIWRTKRKNITTEITKAQNDSVLALWNSRVIENIYFNAEGISHENEKSDFVFYVKADNIDAAKAICENLPFFKQNIADYKIFQAGVFWLGKYDATNP